MRINRYIAQSTGISRRAADKLIQGCKVFINDLPAQLSDHATSNDKVVVDKKRIFLPFETVTIILNKPIGYVCSRDGQGSKTIYDILPAEFVNLRSVGRLDKDSSGLLVLTDDGLLAHELTHPKFEKKKYYEIELNIPLKEADFNEITKGGVDIGDGRPSRFNLIANHEVVSVANYFLPATKNWQVTLTEGRNRQIRRTFTALNYTVKKLHRVSFGDYTLGDLALGSYKKTNI
jgi:23S rRNA pseudouridine2605 synthase